MSENLIAVEFEVPGEKYPVEGINIAEPPQEGEIVEIGARFDGDERLDPAIAEWSVWDNADYRTICRGVVESVTNHYHSAYDRNELQVHVSLVFEDETHGYDPSGLED